MDKNTKTITAVFAFVILMAGVAFASVPLYRLFCQVTGFGGTTARADALPGRVVDRDITVKFDANVARNMAWEFAPEKREETVKLGQQGLIAFHAENRADRPLTGTAIYNVTPNKAGRYFHKIQCFCFGEQTLAPGEEMPMPVLFYVDPAMADDPNMDDVKTITLSYTFFQSGSEEYDRAFEAFANSEKD